jgi:membrane glycosyltransferase
MTIFASISMLIYPIILIFLPTLLISLLVYPHYKTLSVEAKRKWIKVWGNGRVFKGLVVGVVLLCIPTIIGVVSVIIDSVRYKGNGDSFEYTNGLCFNNFLGFNSLFSVVVQILTIGFILAVYKMWINMITPEPDKDPPKLESEQ